MPEIFASEDTLADAVHIVHPDSAARAAIARHALLFGRHAEIYQSYAELFDRLPASGIVIAASLAGEGGLRGLADRLADRRRHMPIIAFSDDLAIHEMARALKEGIAHFIAADIPSAAFQALLEEVVEHNADQLERYMARKEAIVRAEHLTSRERQVMGMIAKGLRTDAIAQSAGIASRTVEIHRLNAVRKLGAKTTAQAVAVYTRSLS